MKHSYYFRPDPGSRCSFSRAALLCGLLLCGWLAVPRSHAADTVQQKAPDAKDASKKVFEWKSKDGVGFSWRGPKKYDAAKGVGLTFILHGSNLTHAWGFANHNPNTFRPDDIVVCPDGTSPSGQGSFNFLEGPDDTKKFHALVEELKAACKIRGVYLYGHSQGSFFALQYAGEYPDEVDGVVAHASGLWLSSKTGAAGHRQAIVLMHGTEDPVVPYAQSVAAYDTLQQAGYPMVRLRSLERWNHWPAENNGIVAHTSQQLAWVEGMTTKDPERLAACFATLAEVKSREAHDWAGLYTLAKHTGAGSAAPAALKARAGKAVTIVETLAKEHAAALTAVKPGAPFEKKAWPAHLVIFLRAFMGVPAREEMAAAWKPALTAQQTAAADTLKAYREIFDKKGREPEAFQKGTALLTGGYLTYLNADGSLASTMTLWAGNANNLKIEREALKNYRTVLEVIKQGTQAFKAVNNKGSAP